MATERATIGRGRKISGVWFIPLLALLLGIFMVIQHWMTEGPTIEIAFDTASGLEQGKTKVKYRNVSMGVVEEVRLNEDFDGVIATVKLDRQTLPLLLDDTRFWVVTAQVGLGNISGLDTLLSGAYIQIAPGTGEKGQRKYVALDRPPLTPTGAPGLRLQLSSERASSVSAGDIVLFKGYKVGRIEDMHFDADESKVRYTIFIDAPFHKLINSSVRFWDVSGLSLSAGADGFKIATGSIETVMLGGVAFGLPDGLSEGDEVAHNTEFKLYTSHDAILKNPYNFGSHYVVYFTQSIKGLLAGAPVEYRGIPIGRVEHIMLKESIDRAVSLGLEGSGDPIPILIYLEPARMELPDKESSLDTLAQAISTGVSHGMRASLESGNLLTGAKYIAIDYFDDVEPAELGTFLNHPTIPTIETGLGQLQQKVVSMLDKVNRLPLDETVTNANAAIASLDRSLQNLDSLLVKEGTQQLPEQLEKTLRDLQAALKGLSPGSDAYRSLNSSLLRLNRTLGNIETMSSTLATQPNALLLPSGASADPVPEVTK